MSRLLGEAGCRDFFVSTWAEAEALALAEADADAPDPSVVDGEAVSSHSNRESPSAVMKVSIAFAASSTSPIASVTAAESPDSTAVRKFAAPEIIPTVFGFGSSRCSIPMVLRK